MVQDKTPQIVEIDIIEGSPEELIALLHDTAAKADREAALEARFERGRQHKLDHLELYRAGIFKRTDDGGIERIV